MLSEKQLKANRNNSKLSSGPKDTSRTRSNALRHGLLTKEALIGTGNGREDPRLLEELSNALWEDLAPTGALEEILVQEIISIIWRKRRLLRHESALASQQAAQAIDSWEQQLPIFSLLNRCLPPGCEPAKSRQMSSGIRFVAMLTAAMWRPVADLLDKEDSFTSSPSIQITVREVARELDAPVGDIMGREPNWQVGESYDAKKVDQVIDVVCESKNISRERFWEKVGEKALEDWRSMSATLTQMLQKATQEANLSCVPDEPGLLKVQRYESHLSRQFEKVLKELQRMQAMRLYVSQQENSG